MVTYLGEPIGATALMAAVRLVSSSLCRLGQYRALETPTGRAGKHRHCGNWAPCRLPHSSGHLAQC